MRLILIVLNLIFSSLAIGADKDVVVIKNPEYVFEGTSEYHRMNKQFEALGLLYGLGPLWGRNTGVTLGYYFDRNSVLELRYAKLDGSVSCSGDWECSGKGKSIGVGYKKYLGNSFYLLGSVDQREASYSEVDNSPYNPYTINFDSSSTLIGLAIGNQWQWENFTIGVDWIGIGYPVLTSISNEKITGNSGYARSYLDTKKKNFATDSVPLALRLNLGVSF